MKSEIIKILSDKKTLIIVCTQIQDIPVPEKRTIDQDTIPTKPTKTTDSCWTNTNISNNKTNHASQDGNSLITSQFRHPSNEIKPKRIKEN